MLNCHSQLQSQAPHWHDLFLAMLPKIRRYVCIAFRHLPGDEFDEAVQESIANACVAVARLSDRGRTDRAFPSALARFAVGQVRDGRRVGTSSNVRDVFSIRGRRLNGTCLDRLDRYDQDDGRWIEAVVEDHRTSVVEQVCFRIDFPEWLQRLSPAKRIVAQALAAGDTTGEVALRTGLSQARISQIRQELADSWFALHGETRTQLKRHSETTCHNAC